MSNFKFFSSAEKYLAQAGLNCLSQVLGFKSFYCSLFPFKMKADHLSRVILRKTMVQHLKQQYALKPVSLAQKETSLVQKKTGLVQKDKLEKLLTPGEIGGHGLAGVSISHGPGAGGFVFCFDQNTFIGFDIEQTSRVTARVMARIAQANEITNAPNKAMLWAAKEAVCKCLNSAVFKNKNKILLKDGLVFGWEQLQTELKNPAPKKKLTAQKLLTKPPIYTFRFKCTAPWAGKKRLKGIGGAFQAGAWVLALTRCYF